MIISHHRARSVARSLGLACLLGTAPVAAVRAQGPVEEILKAASGALDTWRYREADSLARIALQFGPVLTKKQHATALQISAAAVYPEDKPNERVTDSAMARIKRLVTFDPKAWDRNLSWDGLDSLHAMVVRASRPGKVVLGSRTPGAMLFINEVAQGIMPSLRTIELSPDVPQKISIKADKCLPWDTVITVKAADSLIVGRRTLTCTP
jgi:hypothetical protein